MKIFFYVAFVVMIALAITGAGLEKSAAADLDKIGTRGVQDKNRDPQHLDLEGVASHGSLGAERAGFSDRWSVAGFRMRQLQRF